MKELAVLQLTFYLLPNPGRIGYATLRYQFLDVRLVFRQSFVYSITSAMFVGLYIGLVIQSKAILVPIFGEQANIINYVFDYDI